MRKIIAITTANAAATDPAAMAPVAKLFLEIVESAEEDGRDEEPPKSSDGDGGGSD